MINWKKIFNYRFFEPIGLAMLLFAFGLQCRENYLASQVRETRDYHLYKMISHAVEMEYDRAVKDSTVYSGTAFNWLNYDSVRKDVNVMFEEQHKVAEENNERTKVAIYQAILYILGSILVLVEKTIKACRDNE